MTSTRVSYANTVESYSMTDVIKLLQSIYTVHVDDRTCKLILVFDRHDLMKKCGRNDAIDRAIAGMLSTINDVMCEKNIAPISCYINTDPDEDLNQLDREYTPNIKPGDTRIELSLPAEDLETLSTFAQSIIKQCQSLQRHGQFLN